MPPMLASNDPASPSVIEKYLSVADQSGTSYPMARNLAAAAEKANEPGVLEWANTTAQLRLAEWALAISAAILVAWATIILIGVWRRWSWKRQLLGTLIAACALAAGLWTYQKWTPPVDDAIIIYPSTASEGKQPTTANILVSPFDGAEIIGTLTPGTHVVITSDTATNDFIRITHSDNALTGWIPRSQVRGVGQ